MNAVIAWLLARTSARKTALHLLVHVLIAVTGILLILGSLDFTSRTFGFAPSHRHIALLAGVLFLVYAVVAMSCQLRQAAKRQTTRHRANRPDHSADGST